MSLLPESARIEVEPGLARELLEAARSLPLYESKDLYSLELQAEIQVGVRQRVRGGYDQLAGVIRERLGQFPYAVLLRGLEFDDGHRLFVALNRIFGDLVAGPYNPPRAQLVHYIQPATDIVSRDTGLRCDTGSRRDTRTESERFHTDSADWPEPVGIVSMVCVRPDRQGGGRSQVLALDDFRAEVESDLGAEAALRLEREAVPWRLASYHGGGVIWRPVLGESTLRWRRYTVEAALSADGVDLDPDMVDLLGRVDETISRSSNVCEFLMEAGEFLVTDNHRALHARTAITGNYQSSGRLMIRSWVRDPAILREATAEAVLT